MREIYFTILYTNMQYNIENTTFSKLQAVHWSIGRGQNYLNKIFVYGWCVLNAIDLFVRALDWHSRGRMFQWLFFQVQCICDTRLTSYKYSFIIDICWILQSWGISFFSEIFIHVYLSNLLRTYCGTEMVYFLWWLGQLDLFRSTT